MSRSALLASAVVCLSLACARQAPPPGGPEDRTPPQISAMDPPSGAVGVSTRQPVRLSFSKAMRKDEVEHSVHFFPPPPTPPRLHWEGHDLVVSPDTAWDTAQTYVVTLPTEAQDVRGNRLSTTYQSAFSTGTQIDTGRITGQVLLAARPAPGAWILCYRQPRPHSNPELDSADYVVQTDPEGRFALSFLRPGTYRVFALGDRDRDWLWNIGVEELGVPACDLTLEEAGVTRTLPVLHLAVLDTVLPALVDCQRASPGWWALEFDAEVPLAQFDSLSVLEVVGSDTTLLESAVGSAARFSRLLARARSATTGTELLVRHARPGRASEGCVPDPLEARDSLKAFLPVRILPDTAHLWLFAPPEVTLVFNEAVASISDSLILGTGSLQRMEVESAGPFEVRLEPHWDTVTEEPARALVLPGAVRGERGAAWPDRDTVNLTFPLVPLDSAGDYELYIDGLPADPDVDALVEIRRVEAAEAVAQVLLAQGQTATGRLAGGDYLFSLLQDRDGDRAWSPGWPEPFVPSERLWYPTDTLHVRPRFTVQFTLHLVPSVDTLR